MFINVPGCQVEAFHALSQGVPGDTEKLGRVDLVIVCLGQGCLNQCPIQGVAENRVDPAIERCGDLIEERTVDLKEVLDRS